MNYFTFVNGLPAYLITTFFFSFLAYYIGRARWMIGLRPSCLKFAVLNVVWPSLDITVIYLLIYPLVSPKSNLGLYTLPQM